MRWAVVALALLGVSLALVSWHRPPLVLALNPAEFATSNIKRADYVGPEVCAECHEEKREDWGRHLHRTMNTLATPETIVGDFSGAALRYGDGEARFIYTDSKYWMVLDDGHGTHRRFVITRTIGSEFIQEYVGRQTDGPEPATHPLYSTEIRLPFGYWRRPGGWFHQQYYDSWFDEEYTGEALALDPYQPDLSSWRGRCVWCHNTYAFELRLWRSQGPLRRGKGIEQYYRLLGEPDAEMARASTLAELPLDQLVTVGISCESCHLGGREHAEEEKDMHFGPVHPNLQRVPGARWADKGRDEPRVVTALCAQCHSAPSPHDGNGSARRNSSEALDLGQSACASAATCTDCHDPHVRSAAQKDERQHLEACTKCHETLATKRAARAHSRHVDVSCLDCHMPRIVQGFSNVIRTHRIGPALDPAMVAAGQPNACNLCHLNRSTSWAAEQVRLYWKRDDATTTDARPAGEAWLDSSDPHMVVTAAAAYARSSLGKSALPSLVERLDQPVAYYRMRMVFAIEEILGRRLTPDEFEPTASPALRSQQLRELMRDLRLTPR